MPPEGGGDGAVSGPPGRGPRPVAFLDLDEAITGKTFVAIYAMPFGWVLTLP